MNRYTTPTSDNVNTHHMQRIMHNLAHTDSMLHITEVRTSHVADSAVYLLEVVVPLIRLIEMNTIRTFSLADITHSLILADIRWMEDTTETSPN